MESEWVQKYEGQYSVDKTGAVFSHKLGRVKELRPLRHVAGYLLVNLSDGKAKSFRVHRLVAKAFLPNPSNLPCVNHINGNKRDNRVENLEWCTSKENTLHALSLGLFRVAGEDNPSSKLSDALVEQAIQQVLSGELISTVSKSLGVNRNALTNRVKKTPYWASWSEEMLKRKSSLYRRSNTYAT